MTTRLSQKKVKSSDSSYQNLQEELQARIHGINTGSGYVMPAGGIPKSDLSSHLQNLLTQLENSLIISKDGIKKENLVTELQTSIELAETAYQKPTDGIPLSDLSSDLQNLLNHISNFYIFPATGIPRIDLDPLVQEALAKAETAYQKPLAGIGRADLSTEINDILNEVSTKYQKPEDGIPDSDLKERYAKQQDLDVYNKHIQDASIHITEHDKLFGVGKYTHQIIDEKLDENHIQIMNILKEIEEARDDFNSLGSRLNALLGLNSFYKVETKLDWERGQLKHLLVNDEGTLRFSYQPEAPVIELFDIEKGDAFLEENRIGHLLFRSSSRVVLDKNEPWVHVSNRRYNVGVRIRMNIFAEKSGFYEFGAQFSGRMRMQVGSKLLFDTQGAYQEIDAYTKVNQVYLNGGRLYPLVFEGWYRFDGERIVGITWRPPEQSFHSEIPQSYMNVSGYTYNEGEYISEIIDLKDNNISKWMFELKTIDYRSLDDIKVYIRTSDNGQDFGDWYSIDYTKDEIEISPKRYCQIKIEIYRNFDSYTPLINGYVIRYISSAHYEFMKEIIEARSSFLSLKERFDSLDEKMNQVINFEKKYDNVGNYPEFFTNVRLISEELNTLRYFLLEAERQTDFILLDNGFVDTFKTSNLIDDSRSDRYEIVNESLKFLSNVTRLESNNEWAQWNLDKLDYIDDKLRLAKSTTGAIAKTIAFNNWNLSGTRGSARLGFKYYKFIAQPFYTSSDVNLLTRIQIQAQIVNSPPRVTVMICPVKEGSDIPDVLNPIWSQSLNYPSTGVINITGLRIPVYPLTKYWLVLRQDQIQNNDGYVSWYVANNSTNTNIRVRSDNPEKKGLFIMCTADSNGENGWIVDNNWFLSFYIDEGLAFEPIGYGYRIIDYGSNKNFLLSDVDVDLSNDGLFLVNYQSSNDMNIWSTPVENIKDVPSARFLKINVTMQRASTNHGSPLLNRIDIHHINEYSQVVTKPIKSRYGIPTHAILYGHYDEGISFEFSRDDGYTWCPLELNKYTELKNIHPGEDIRIRIKADGNYPLSMVHNYGVMFITYRDITQQNITALYEEYIAEDGQQIFKLADRYIPGNHSLQVFVNGIRQSVIKDYIEIDEQTVMFTEPLVGGIDADVVTFIVAAGVYNEHDAISHAKIDEVRELVNQINVPHEIEHIYDEQNRLIETKYNIGYFIKRISYEYDEHNRKKKETIETKTYIKETEYTYNEHGLLIHEKVSINGVTI